MREVVPLTPGVVRPEVAVLVVPAVDLLPLIAERVVVRDPAPANEVRPPTLADLVLYTPLLRPERFDVNAALNPCW